MGRVRKPAKLLAVTYAAYFMGVMFYGLWMITTGRGDEPMPDFVVWTFAIPAYVFIAGSAIFGLYYAFKWAVED